MKRKAWKKKTNFKGDDNPFNVKLNREKHSILGKTAKGTKGLRCISQAQSFHKRREVLLKKRHDLGKANNFVDNRFMKGESAEDVAVSRLVHERKKKFKKNIFNLNDEDFLTHNGVPLNDIQTFRREADDSDEEELSAAYVKKAHFGNFASDASEEKPLSHKELIDQLISESKQKKYEKKIERDSTLDLIDQLDQDWKSFHGAVGAAKEQDSKLVSSKPDSYDVVAQQLRSAARGTATARTKTAEELEEEEQEKAEILEQERFQRMSDGLTKTAKSLEHVSADSLCDDYAFEPLIDTETEHKSIDENEDSIDILGPNNNSDEDDSDDESEDNTESDGDIPPEEDEGDDDIVSNIPLNIKEFDKYMASNSYTSDQAHVAVEKLLRPVHNAKAEGTLKKLAMFLKFIIKFSLDNIDVNPNVSGNLVPCLYKIAEISPVKSAEVLLSLLDEEHSAFQKNKQERKKCNYSLKNCIVLLKYSSVLYSVSDFRHPVVTPSVIFICDILSTPFPITYSHVAQRLMICKIVFDCVSQSQRLVPDALCFLNKVLMLAVPDEITAAAGMTKKPKFNLILHEKHESDEIIPLNVLKSKQKIDDSLKVAVIFNVLDLLQKFGSLYKLLPSFRELFAETSSVVSKLSCDHYPPVLKKIIHFVTLTIGGQREKLYPLRYENVKPKPLKLFEPAFDSKFSKKVTIKKQFRQLKQVSQKIRKEEKGLIREMRRDVQVVTAQKLKETLESDADRKRKVKKLYHELAMQEGEYKKMMKQK